MAESRIRLQRQWLSLKFLILILAFCVPANILFAFTPPSSSDMPGTITVAGKNISLKNLKNPHQESAENIREGGKIYFKHCFLCHGDLLDGKGLYGNRFYPAPASFIHSHSVLKQPQSYAFWRIMKGGKDLPEKFSPWDSSMPAWEGVLDEDQAWKVITFIYATASQRLAEDENFQSEPSVQRGKLLYAEKCAYCHGDKGDGKGVSANYSSPMPRKFTKGHIKLRSTPFGKIPTDQDLFEAISKGMTATTMPGWSHLSESNRWSLVYYLKTLSTKFERFVKRGKKHQITVVPPPPPFKLKSLSSGQALYLRNCLGCHGLKGRSDGVSTKRVVDINNDSIWPRNLSKPWTFRRGAKRTDIFKTLRTGLSGTTMPRFSPRVFKDEQIWDIVNYVQTLSLSKKPPVAHLLKVKKTDSLSLDPKDPIWNSVDTHFYPLGGQIMQAPKAYFPMTDSLMVKALHDENEIAFHLQWDDPRFDPILKTRTQVKESPAPPLPPHLQLDESEEEPTAAPEAQEFPDSLAIQFPVSLYKNGEKPYFLNGDPDHPVNVWKWESHPLETREMNATGIDSWTTQLKTGQEVSSKVVYAYGRYQLVMKRKLNTGGQNDIQFISGQAIPIAFNVWDGSSGETGTKKAVSSWFQMILE